MYHLQSLTKRQCCQEVQRELIRAQIQQLIAQLHELCKEECFMVSACVRSSSYSLLGSPKGQEYMQELWGVQSGFLPYLQKVEKKGVSLCDISIEKSCLPSSSADCYQPPEMTDGFYGNMCILGNNSEGDGPSEDNYTPIELESDAASINQCISSEIEVLNDAVVVSNNEEINLISKQHGELLLTDTLANDSQWEISDSQDLRSFFIADDALVKQEVTEDNISVSQNSDSDWDDEDDIQEIGAEEIQQILADMSKLGQYCSSSNELYQSTNIEMQDSKVCARVDSCEVKVKEEMCTAEDQRLFAITNVQGAANSIYQIQNDNSDINDIVHDVRNVKLESEVSIDHEIKLKQKLEKNGTNILNTNRIMQLIPESFNICSFCNKHLRCIKERMEHESRHTQVFKCFRCDIKFAKREQLRRHVKICLVIPDFLGVLYSKFVTVGSEKKKQIVENSVGFPRDSLKKLTNEGEGNQPFYCDSCNQSFKCRMEMNKHICKARETTVSENHVTKCENDTKNFIHNKSVTISSSEELKHHINHFKSSEQCNDLRKFKCSHCDKAFLRSYKLVDHIACVHTREMRFKCSACQKTFMARYQFRRHSKMCSKIYAKTCTLQTYIDKQAVDNSIRFQKDNLKKLTNKLEGNQPFYCGNCGQSFKHRTEMNKHICKARETTVSKNHVTKSESDTKSFIRNKSVIIRSSQGLKRHINHFKSSEQCNDLRKFKCLHCGKAFLQSYKLVDHIACVHTREMRFKCSACPKTFMARYQFRRHPKTCSKIYAKTCTLQTYLDKQIVDNSIGSPRDSLKKLKNTLEGNQPFYCGNCNQSFKLKTEMNKHICKARETTVSENHVTKCENDTKSFIHNKSVTLKSSQDIKCHINHFKTLEQCNDLRKFKCSHCGKAFLQSYKLVDHIACVHTREMRFKCSACPKTFMARYQFRRHPKTCSKIYAETCTLQTYLDKQIVDNSIGPQRDIFTKLTDALEGNQPFYCSSCGKSFKFKMILDKHICTARETTVSENHITKCENDTKSFIPNKNVTFRSSQRFRCHVNYFKTSEHFNEYRKFKCSLCGKAFLKSSHLVNHVACVHTQKRRFKCSACPKTFMAEYLFRRHLKTCSKIYADTCTLQKL